MKRKTRIRFEDGSIRFLTFGTYRRQAHLADPRIRDIFVEQLALAVERGLCSLYAFVVMPDHVHLLLTPSEDTTITALLSGIKTRSATRANQLLARKGLPFWQQGGGYDRNIHTRDEFIEKREYIHANPVTRGLVERNADWVHSSAAFYDGLAYSGPTITPVDTDFRW